MRINKKELLIGIFIILFLIMLVGFIFLFNSRDDVVSGFSDSKNVVSVKSDVVTQDSNKDVNSLKLSGYERIVDGKVVCIDDRKNVTITFANDPLGYAFDCPNTK